MTKKIITALLALTMLFMTACGEDNSTDTSKADTTTTTSVTEQTEDGSSDSEDTTTTTTTTTQETTTTTTAETSKKEEKTTTKATTTTKQAVATTTTQAYTYTQATTKATVKPVQTTKATVKVTAKATTKATVKTTPKPTQPAANKSALDLAYEAVILGTSTKAQRDLICNDLNNYVIAKGYSKKLDKSLYALSDANGKPVEDVTLATDWGNSSFENGADNSNYTTAYLLKSSTLEIARENYKAWLKSHIDYNVSCLIKIYNKPFSTYKFNAAMYKDTGVAPQRVDLAKQYKIPRYTMVLCYLHTLN